MSRYSTGIYTPVNFEKYVGTRLPKWRSSWEREFMKVLDLSDGVINWDSEPLQIPYLNPLTGRQTVYVPDFLVQMIEQGERVTKLIEIKPITQAFSSHVRSDQDAQDQVRNQAKWAAAMQWCARRSGESGMPVRFVIYTEADMFAGGKAILPTGRTVKTEGVLGRVTKKATRVKRPVRAKTIMEALVKKAKRASGMHKRGRISTRVVRVRRVRSAPRAPRI